MWAVWSRNDEGTFHLYARAFDGKDWSAAQKLTGLSGQGGGSNIWPRLASDGKGKLALVWQGFRNDRAAIVGRLWNGSAWSAETILNEGAGNCWVPAVAFGGREIVGRVGFVCHRRVPESTRGQWTGAVQRITKGENFSVRPSVAVSAQGTPVVAWEESDALWGKDFTFLFDRRGTPIYTTRRVRLAALEGGDWKELPAAVESMPADLRRYQQQPQLAMDDSGHLYMTFRSRTSAGTVPASIIGPTTGAGRRSSLTSDGGRWTPAVTMPSSVGRNSRGRPSRSRAAGRTSPGLRTTAFGRP